MLGLKLNYVDKRGPWPYNFEFWMRSLLIPTESLSLWKRYFTVDVILILFTCQIAVWFNHALCTLMIHIFLDGANAISRVFEVEHSQFAKRFCSNTLLMDTNEFLRRCLSAKHKNISTAYMRRFDKPVSQIRAPSGGLSRTSGKLWQDYSICYMFWT